MMLHVEIQGEVFLGFFGIVNLGNFDHFNESRCLDEVRVVMMDLPAGRHRETPAANTTLRI